MPSASSCRVIRKQRVRAPTALLESPCSRAAWSSCPSCARRASWLAPATHTSVSWATISGTSSRNNQCHKLLVTTRASLCHAHTRHGAEQRTAHGYAQGEAHQVHKQEVDTGWTVGEGDRVGVAMVKAVLALLAATATDRRALASWALLLWLRLRQDSLSLRPCQDWQHPELYHVHHKPPHGAVVQIHPPLFLLSLALAPWSCEMPRQGVEEEEASFQDLAERCARLGVTCVAPLYSIAPIRAVVLTATGKVRQTRDNHVTLLALLSILSLHPLALSIPRRRHCPRLPHIFEDLARGNGIVIVRQKDKERKEHARRVLLRCNESGCLLATRERLHEPHQLP